MEIWYLNKEQTIYLLIKMSARTDIDRAITAFGFEEEIMLIKNREEAEFLKILQSIIDGFNLNSDNKIVLKHQYSIAGYLVDYCIYKDVCGEHYIMLMIEYDEDRHKYRTNEDEVRKNNIIAYLKSIDTSYDFSLRWCNVNDLNQLEAITDIVCCLNSEHIIDPPNSLDGLKATKIEEYRD